ncbi:hypothetical protein K438DRAFT_554977 [Mycena galopus ATCC 62051]|nr:hypothetical protein K438DRAFT_554977 [Mycena galopus ATCC 62051]
MEKFGIVLPFEFSALRFCLSGDNPCEQPGKPGPVIPVSPQFQYMIIDYSTILIPDSAHLSDSQTGFTPKNCFDRLVHCTRLVSACILTSQWQESPDSCCSYQDAFTGARGGVGYFHAQFIRICSEPVSTNLGPFLRLHLPALTPLTLALGLANPEGATWSWSRPFAPQLESLELVEVGDDFSVRGDGRVAVVAGHRPGWDAHPPWRCALNVPGLIMTWEAPKNYTETLMEKKGRLNSEGRDW